MQNALKARGKTNEEVKAWMQIDSKDRRARKLCQKYGPRLTLHCVEYAIRFHYHRFLIMFRENKQMKQQTIFKQTSIMC